MTDNKEVTAVSQYEVVKIRFRLSLANKVLTFSLLSEISIFNNITFGLPHHIWVMKIVNCIIIL